MAYWRNSAEGGTDGVTATTGNTGGASGDAFSSFSPAGTLAFSDDGAAQGDLCYDIVASSGNARIARVIFSAAEDTQISMYFRRRAAVTASCNLLQTRTSADQAGPGITITTDSDGRVTVGAVGGVVYSNAAANIAQDTWYRIEQYVHKGTTSSDGTIQFALYAGNSLTPLATYSSTAVNTRTDDSTEWRIGRLTATADTSLWQIDGIQIWTGADCPGTLGHPWPDPPLVGAGVDNLFFAPNPTGGTAPYAIVQDSGTTTAADDGELDGVVGVFIAKHATDTLVYHWEDDASLATDTFNVPPISTGGANWPKRPDWSGTPGSDWIV